MPYSSLPATAFWKAGVQNSDPMAMQELYRKKFEISKKDRVMTAGSCFAQHIARHLRSNGFTVLDTEPAPRRLSAETAQKFGYGLFSARYANIYTVRQMKQLIEETSKPIADGVWTKDGRFYDAQRPGVEPYGLDSAEEVIAHRKEHLAAVSKAIRSTDVFVFTFGLTEAWVHKASGTVFPTAPGTIAGQFDPDVYEFKNFTFEEIYKDFLSVRSLLRRRNPNMRFIITVSPVPLTATASGDHVLQASTYSKAVLRAVAGQLAKELHDVAYFPSFEIITNPKAESAFYAQNLRSIATVGVGSVMGVFFSAHADGAYSVAEKAPAPLKERPAEQEAETEDGVVCEEMLLEAFAR